MKKPNQTIKKVQKEQRQKIIVEKADPNAEPNKRVHTVYIEFVASAQIAKERVKELKEEYPDCSVCYFSV